MDDSEKYYADKIFQSTTHTKTATGEKTVSYEAAVEAFSKFNVNYEISFILFPFHNHSDDLSGLYYIRNMNLFIDFTRNVLFHRFTEVPIVYNLNRQKHNTSVNVCEIVAVKIPLDKFAEVVILEDNVNDLHFLETLT